MNSAIWSVAVRGAEAAVPLLLAATGELVSERAGLINIGIEGTMLTGAFAGAAFAWWSGSALAGAAVAAAAGGLVGLLFGLWTVAGRRDQIVTGLGVNLLAAGFTGVAVQRIAARCASEGRSFVPPGLWDAAPIDVLMVAAVVLVAVTHVVLYHTRPGLTLRAVGENPAAADAAGVRVGVVRMVAAGVGCAMAGLAGAYLSLGLTRSFQEQMTGGRGFLALALVIVGRWSPAGVFAAALMFGLLNSLQEALQPTLGAHVYLLYPALLALPYVLTLAVLAGWAGRTRPPAAQGSPYERGAEA